MAKLNASTVVSHPETGEPTFLAEGSDVPEWASDLVGEHLVEQEKKAPARAAAK